MVQKLLVIERNTKSELMDAIRKNVLEAGLRVVGGFSVLEQVDEIILGNGITDSYPDSMTHLEAWMIVEVPENTDRFYESVGGKNYTIDPKTNEIKELGSNRHRDQ